MKVGCVCKVGEYNGEAWCWGMHHETRVCAGGSTGLLALCSVRAVCCRAGVCPAGRSQQLHHCTTVLLHLPTAAGMCLSAHTTAARC
jgi:hypothetical protein